MSEGIDEKLEAVLSVLSDFRFRWLFGRSQGLIEAGKLKPERSDEILRRALRDEVERQLMVGLLRKKGPMTIGELAEATGLNTEALVRHIIALRWVGRVIEVGQRGVWYMYGVQEAEAKP